jgi:hypothetical protein
MLPQDVLEAFDRMEEMTKGNTKYVKSQVPSPIDALSRKAIHPFYNTAGADD